jgi:XTP/dITP diphosphohydrolase
MSHPLLLGTNNSHKAGEIRAMLAHLDVRVVTPRELGITDDPVENGETFEANALIKARFFAGRTDFPCLADDSGLEVEALGGRPGVFSSRYAPTDAERIARLLGELRDVPPEARTARFVCVTALVVPPAYRASHSGSSAPSSTAFTPRCGIPLSPGDAPLEIVEIGTCEGRIASEARGAAGFGYDPVFFVPHLGRTMAELSSTEKNAISHRGCALAAMKLHLVCFFG